MFRKFLAGLAFGAGFVVAVIVLVYAWAAIDFNISGRHSLEEVSKAPHLASEDVYFSGSCYRGEFQRGSAGVLMAGPGEIRGRVTANGQGVAGLRLRLALNGGVFSQWAETKSDGTYAVTVPYDDYRIDGRELDMKQLPPELAGKIMSPASPCMGWHASVYEGSVGEGLDLEFVDPVVFIGPTGDIKVGDSITVEWAPFPDAETYRVQVFESSTRNTWQGFRPVFEHPENPEVSGTRLDLLSFTGGLRAGYFYDVHITAIDADGRHISETPGPFRAVDFRIVD